MYIYMCIIIYTYLRPSPILSDTVRYICIGMYIYIYIYVNMYPPTPMNHLKILKGWPLRDAPSKLVQLLYKTFPPDHIDLAEMKNPTRLSNKTSTA